jgi:hypothetical protein
MGLNPSHSDGGSVPGRVTLSPSVRGGRGREAGKPRHAWAVALPGQRKKPGTGRLWITQENPAMTGPVAVFYVFPVLRFFAGKTGKSGKTLPVEQFEPVEHLVLLTSRLRAPDREDCRRLWFVAGAAVFGNVSQDCFTESNGNRWPFPWCEVRTALRTFPRTGFVPPPHDPNE